MHLVSKTFTMEYVIIIAAPQAEVDLPQPSDPYLPQQQDNDGIQQQITPKPVEYQVPPAGDQPKIFTAAPGAVRPFPKGSGQGYPARQTAPGYPHGLQPLTYTAAPGVFPQRTDMYTYQPLAPQQQFTRVKSEGEGRRGEGEGRGEEAGEGRGGEGRLGRGGEGRRAPLKLTHCPYTIQVVNSQPSVLAVNYSVKPQNYMGLSILTCLCCCWVLGLIAIMYSNQVSHCFTL